MLKLKVLYYKARNYIVARFYNLVAKIWIKTPWFKAILRTALMAYHDSPLYRERHMAFGPEFAFKSFFEYNELGFWKWVAKRDGRMDWQKIVLTPWAIHQDARMLLNY